MKRAIILVIDSMGIGAMHDCCEFGDVPECNTLRNVCEFNDGLNIPTLEKMGLGNIQNFKGIKQVENPTSVYGTLIEKSKGKDTTTGHWEIMGLVSETPFATFPKGFPQDLVEKFVNETNCGG
ncbi:MAG: phosphopentomutase, partial [Alphaproteobacteria bacterium]|nr:phosphopentomutase [Alphaproteobacteria bacterium]